MSERKIFDNYLSSGILAVNVDFDRHVKDYDEVFGPLLPKNKSAKILDIGCGMGRFLYFLEKKGYTNFYGIDISKESIDYCKQHVTMNCTRIDMLSNFLMNHKNEFDLITLIGVIEYWDRNEVVPNLEAIYNFLMGELIIETANTTLLSGLYYRYYDFPRKLAFYEFGLKQVLLIAGFKKINIEGNRVKFKFNFKRLLWILGQRIWFAILRIIHWFEVGPYDSPKIYSKNLIAIAEK